MSSLHADLANKVLDHIMRNRLPAGTHLPEPDLCARFHVSRTPIRGALHLLCEQNFVKHIPNRGFFTINGGERIEREELPESEEESLYLEIAEDRINRRVPAQNSEADLLRRYQVPRATLIRILQRLLREGLVEKRPGRGWMFTPVLDSKRMHDESYRFRLAIEPQALLEDTFRLDEKAAERCAAKHQRVVDGSLRQITPIELFEMNAEFHELLAACSGNRFFLQAIQQQNRLRRFITYHWTYGADRVIETCAEHLAILEAVREGEMRWASALLRRHIEVSSALSPYGDTVEDGKEIENVHGEPMRVIKLKPR